MLRALERTTDAAAAWSLYSLLLATVDTANKAAAGTRSPPADAGYERAPSRASARGASLSRTTSTASQQRGGALVRSHSGRSITGPSARRTDRTRLVPPPVLIGHASSQPPY